MFLPGASLKVKLVGIAVLAIITFSVIGATLAAVNQVVAEGSQQPQISGEEFARFGGSQDQASDGHAVVNGLKFVCPFH
ncbi:MAG: hypothetical protein O2860_08375 [Chloroflexi bacterium]|nr:hypothetical protein [Chloroflexota bacterium]